MNYFNYFTEIEQFYQSRRESFTLLSTLDWVLIENWKEQGIPLDTVLKGIDLAFSRAKRKINSLGYCVKAVEQIIEEQKDTNPGKPDVPEIPRGEIVNYLEDLAARTRAVTEVFPEFAARINAIAEAIVTVDPTEFREAEQTLTALEERLAAILKVAADESAAIELRKAVDAELAPFRATMTAEQLAMLEQQLSRRKLLERYKVPRLSLFYLL